MKKLFSLAMALLCGSAVALADNAEFVSMYPAEGSSVNAETEYIITFSKAVTFTSYLSDITIGYNPFGEGDGATFTQSEDQTQIIAKLDMDMLSNYGIKDMDDLVAWFGNTVSVHFYGVKDAESGEAVVGNDPEDEKQFTFNYNLGEAKLRIEPMEGNVESLSEIYFSFAEGIKLTEDAASKTILLMKNKQEVESITADQLEYVEYGIGYLEDGDDDEFGNDEEQTGAGYYVMKLSEVYTDAANYELYLPDGVFVLGAEGKVNETTIVSWMIVDQNATYVLNPAEGEVESLDEITITWKGDQIICVSGMDQTYVTLSNEAGEVIASWDAEYMWMNMDMSWCDESGWDLIRAIVKLDEPITEPGTYTLHIDAEFFYVGENYENGPAADFVYTIGGGSSINKVTVKNNEQMYNLQGQRVNEAKGLVIKGGKKVCF